MRLTKEQEELVLENLDDIKESMLAERFDDLLNDVYGTVKIAGYDYEAADAFQAVDMIAYREDFLNWLDGDESIVEICGLYFDADEVNELLSDDGEDVA